MTGYKSSLMISVIASPSEIGAWRSIIDSDRLPRLPDSESGLLPMTKSSAGNAVNRLCLEGREDDGVGRRG